MLKSIEIESLFNLYTYKIILSSDDSLFLRFITGPNGFGKTTILNIIFDIYNLDFEALSHILFKKVKLVYDDETEIRIDRQVMSEQMEDSDEKEIVDISFNIGFHREAQGLNDEIRCSQGNGFMLPMATNLQNYLGSMPVYYVRDNRLFDQDRLKPSVRKKAAGFAAILSDLKYKYSTSIINHLSTDLPASKEDIGRRISRITKYLDLLSDLGFLQKEAGEDFIKSSASYIKGIESFIENEKSQLDKILTFKSVIGQFAFVNKKLQMNDSWGFRFIANDADRTILSADKLSSGEQHIIILAYDLLFESEDDSIFLIDEPELSFHLSWQGEFLAAINKIIEIRKIQCIIATHSGQIFQHQWQISSDLFLAQNE